MECDITCAELFSEWLKSKEKSLKPASYGAYSLYVWKHIIPTIGEVVASEIDNETIQDAINSWQSGGNLKTGEVLSEKTVKEIVGVIRQGFKFYGKKTGNYMLDFDDLEYSKDARNEVKVFTRDEQAKIVKAIFKNKTHKNAGIALGLLAGMRIGEVCALKWSNIDLLRNKIDVRETLNVLYTADDTGKFTTVVHTGEAKTQDSIREIPIGGTLHNILSVIEPEEGTDNRSDIYVVSGKTDALVPSLLREYFYRFLEKLGIPRRTFHSLRHSFGTKHVACGTPIPYISKLMGHKNTTITMNLYLHPQFEDLEKAVKDIDDKWM